MLEQIWHFGIGFMQSHGDWQNFMRRQTEVLNERKLFLPFPLAVAIAHCTHTHTLMCASVSAVSHSKNNFSISAKPQKISTLHKNLIKLFA